MKPGYAVFIGLADPNHLLQPSLDASKRGVNQARREERKKKKKVEGKHYDGCQRKFVLSLIDWLLFTVR
jgi:hypothetical protein